MYSVICKLLNNSTENRPVEFMTSLCADLSSHTASKTDEELLNSVWGSLAHNTAFTFIDAIDPVGTINEKRYERMRRIGEKTRRERENIAPDAKLISDVTYYVNYNSLADFDTVPMKHHTFKDKITSKMTNFAEAMIERHIAYDVNVRKNLAQIKSPVIFISDQRILEADEVRALTAFVENGGTLIATQQTGTLTKQGTHLKDFALHSLLGVHYEGESPFNTSYVRRKDASVKEFIDYDEGYPVAVNGSATLVRADTDTEILAYVTLPVSSSSDADHFSSAISDPPITDTMYPAITRKRLGKGQAIYIAAALEESRHFEGRRLLSELILSAKKRQIEAEAPAWLEVLVYHDEEKKRYTVHCMNTMPGYSATAHNVNIYLQTDNKIQSAHNVTTDESVSFTQTEKGVSILLESVDGYALTELKY
jgi:beta-galactosidase GanA